MLQDSHTIYLSFISVLWRFGKPNYSIINVDLVILIAVFAYDASLLANKIDYTNLTQEQE